MITKREIEEVIHEYQGLMGFSTLDTTPITISAGQLCVLLEVAAVAMRDGNVVAERCSIRNGVPYGTSLHVLRE